MYYKNFFSNLSIFLQVHCSLFIHYWLRKTFNSLYLQFKNYFMSSSNVRTKMNINRHREEHDRTILFTHVRYLINKYTGVLTCVWTIIFFRNCTYACFKFSDIPDCLWFYCFTYANLSLIGVINMIKFFLNLSIRYEKLL